MDTKNTLIEHIEKSGEEFLDNLDSLETEDFSKPLSYSNPVNNQAWTIKDIIIHISRWEAELIKLMWQLKQGQKPAASPFSLSPSKVDTLNNTWQTEASGRQLEQAIEDYHAVRSQTLLRLEAFTDQELFAKNRYAVLAGRSLAEIIANNTFEHEMEHLANIHALKASRHET